MKGQFFIIATIVIISSLSLIIRYLYDFNKINLTKVEEMHELNYIQYVKESYKETINAVLLNDGCDRLEADLNYTTEFLKNNLNKKGIILITEDPIIETECSSVKLNFSLVSSEFYTYTTFYGPILTCTDETLYGECSSNKPLYCDNGNLVNNCTQCGCPSGQNCNTISEDCYTPPSYIFEDGFESGYITEAEGGAWTGTWTTTGETVTIVTTDPYQGTYHLNAKSDGSSTGERSAVYKNIAAQGILYMRAYVKFKYIPDSSGEQTAFFWFYNIASGRALAQGHLVYSDGTAKWGVNYNDGSTWASFTSTTTANADNLYYVELYWKKGITDGECKLYVNGAEVVSETGKDTDDFGDANRVYVGDLWDNFAVENYVDNVVVDDEYIGP